jgi:hypothetical protein
MYIYVLLLFQILQHTYIYIVKYIRIILYIVY